MHTAEQITKAAREEYQRNLDANGDIGMALDAAGEKVREMAAGRTGMWDQETLTWSFDDGDQRDATDLELLPDILAL